MFGSPSNKSEEVLTPKLNSMQHKFRESALDEASDLERRQKGSLILPKVNENDKSDGKERTASLSKFFQFDSTKVDDGDLTSKRDLKRNKTIVGYLKKWISGLE